MGGNMLMREYIKLWFKQSLSQTLTIGDTISGVVGTIVGIMGHYSPQWKNEVSENEWLIAIYALAATAFGRFFIFAPYELWKVQREKVNKYEDLLSNIGTERPLHFKYIEFQFNTENENVGSLTKLRFYHINMGNCLVEYELSNVFIETETKHYNLRPKSGKVFSNPGSVGFFDVPLEEFISFEKFPATIWVNFDFIYDTSPSVKTRTTGAKVRYELTDNKPGSTVHGPWYDDQRED
jgi:hypothetical protein